jgi:hypothetical protein
MTPTRLRLALIVPLLLALLIPASGCALLQIRPTSTATQAVRAHGRQVALAINHALDAALAVQELEIDEHRAGRVTADQHRTNQRAFLVLFQVLDVALADLHAATTNAHLRATVDVVKKELTAIGQTLAGNGNPQSRTWSRILSIVVVALDVASGLIGVA